MEFLDLDGLKTFKSKLDDLYLSTNNATKIRGKINLTKETKLTLANKYAVLSNNSIVFYLITDSTGKLPSTSETRININSDITSLVSAEGANVGDIFIIGKLSSLPVYRIIPLNDAKAETTDFKGTNGVMTPWDKTRVNKVNAIEATANNAANNLPTYGESNMNNALNTGVYPWCTLGRPTGAKGAFTCITKKSTTKDGNGYWTIEQTAYGRQDEEGQIYKRVIFKQDGKDAEYSKWINVTTFGVRGIRLEGSEGPSNNSLIYKNSKNLSITDNNCVSISSGDFQFSINGDDQAIVLNCFNIGTDQIFRITLDKEGHSIKNILFDYNRITYKFDFNKAIELGIITQV